MARATTCDAAVPGRWSAAADGGVQPRHRSRPALGAARAGVATAELLEVTLPAGPCGPRAGRVSAGTAGLLRSDVVRARSGLRVVRPSTTLGPAGVAARACRTWWSSVTRPWPSGLATAARSSGRVDDARHPTRQRRVMTPGADPAERPRRESPMESRLEARRSCSAGLPEPAVNQDVVVDGVLHRARPDLSYPALKIAIEYEGDHHRTDRRQWRRDKTRRRLLEDTGWLVIEVIADDVVPAPRRSGRTASVRPSPSDSRSSGHRWGTRTTARCPICDRSTRRPACGCLRGRGRPRGRRPRARPARPADPDWVRSSLAGRKQTTTRPIATTTAALRNTSCIDSEKPTRNGCARRGPGRSGTTSRSASSRSRPRHRT